MVIVGWRGQINVKKWMDGMKCRKEEWMVWTEKSLWMKEWTSSLVSTNISKKWMEMNKYELKSRRGNEWTWISMN